MNFRKMEIPIAKPQITFCCTCVYHGEYWASRAREAQELGIQREPSYGKKQYAPNVCYIDSIITERYSYNQGCSRHERRSTI